MNLELSFITIKVLDPEWIEKSREFPMSLKKHRNLKYRLRCHSIAKISKQITVLCRHCDMVGLLGQHTVFDILYP